VLGSQSSDLAFKAAFACFLACKRVSEQATKYFEGEFYFSCAVPVEHDCGDVESGWEASFGHQTPSLMAFDPASIGNCKA